MPSSENIYTIRYSIDVKLFTEDGKNDVDPPRIDSMSWIVDYNKSFTPMITIILQLLPGHINIIKKNMNKMLMHMVLKRIKFSNSTENALNRVAVETSIIYDTIFVPIIEVDDIINLKEFPESKENAVPDDQFVPPTHGSLNVYNVRMYINTLEYHMMYKKTFNTVLRSSSNGPIKVETALKYICEASDASGYIIDKPDNEIPMNNIIIPPGNVKYAIDSLQILYGIYLKDIISFFDIDSKLYILSKLNKTHDYESGKIRKTLLRIATTNLFGGINPGTVQYDTKDTIIHNLVKNLEDMSIGIAAGEAKGDSIIFTNFGFASETFKYSNGDIEGVNESAREYIRNAISHSKTGKGVSFEYDELNNPFNMFSNLNSESADTVYFVKSTGMDLDCLKPNVIFNIEMVGDAKDNARFIDKDFNLIRFEQQFFRDNDPGTVNIFKSLEALSLTYVKQ